MTTETQGKSTAHPRGSWMWPGMVFVLLGMSCTLVVTTVFLAHRNGGAIIEADYYEKGLRWDEHKAELAQSKATGWSHAVQVSRGDGGSWDVLVRIVDGDGETVDDASVMLRVYHAGAPRDVRSVGLSAEGRGGYRGSIDGVPAGTWVYELDARGEGEALLLAHGRADAVGY